MVSYYSLNKEIPLAPVSLVMVLEFNFPSGDHLQISKKSGDSGVVIKGIDSLFDYQIQVDELVIKQNKLALCCKSFQILITFVLRKGKERKESKKHQNQSKIDSTIFNLSSKPSIQYKSRWMNSYPNVRCALTVMTVMTHKQT